GQIEKSIRQMDRAPRTVAHLLKREQPMIELIGTLEVSHHQRYMSDRCDHRIPLLTSFLCRNNLASCLTYCPLTQRTRDHFFRSYGATSRAERVNRKSIIMFAVLDRIGHPTFTLDNPARDKISAPRDEAARRKALRRYWRRDRRC